MADLVEVLSQRALALAPEDRVHSAEELLATVHAFDAEIDAAWEGEIRRRVSEIENGTATLIP